jgi:Homeodomain-like domain
MSDFQWNDERSEAARLLAQGLTKTEVAGMVGVDERTVYRWQADTDFAAEVDRLTLSVDIAGRAARLRIAMRVARQSVMDDGEVLTRRDLLDWLKFAQSETSGITLDVNAMSHLASLSGAQRRARIDELLAKHGYSVSPAIELPDDLTTLSDDELEAYARELR